MSKIITLSNLERFHGHLNFSGGSGYIKAIAANDTSGNIYVNTSDGKLYYKSNGTWSAITLYSSKPRAKNLVLRVSNSLKYAGLVDPSDANASKIRVRIGNTIYAVETDYDNGWAKTRTVLADGTISIPPAQYVQTSASKLIPLGGADDVEIYLDAMITYSSSPTYQQTFFWLIPEDMIGNFASPITKSFNDVRVGSLDATSKILSTNKLTTATSTNFITNGTNVFKVYHTYKWIYNSSNKICSMQFDGVQKMQESLSALNYYVAIGNVKYSSSTEAALLTVRVRDFYVKVAGETIISLAGMKIV